MPRCADCGFLSLRDQKTLQFMEVAEEGRAKWDFPSTGVGIGTTQEFVRHRVPIYYEVPFCAVGAMAIDQEAGGRLPDQTLPVITKERDCSSFFKWRRNYSPKEHQEMMTTQELREFQRQESEKNRQWQEEQGRLQFHRQCWLALIVAAIGIIGVVIGKLL
jgi:hypothetical protein